MGLPEEVGDVASTLRRWAAQFVAKFDSSVADQAHPELKAIVDWLEKQKTPLAAPETPPAPNSDAALTEADAALQEGMNEPG